MNIDVVNEIFKRRPARDFLRLYPSDKWKELIPDIFEIGVLNLKNSFGTLKFTKAQIKDILLDLRNYKPNDNNTEEEYFENDDNINNINKEINKEKEDIKDIKERTANAEVFIPNENNIKIKVNYNRPKIAYNSTMEEIREKNIENRRNLGYTESKIKYQIMNDKKNHQMKKRKIINDNNNNDNERNFSFNKNKNKREKNMDKNYIINFDKNLNPQKPIEKQKNRFDYDFNNYNEFNEENIFNRFNNEDNYIHNGDSFNDENNIINNNNQNVQNHLNNFKINMLNVPKYGFGKGNFNDN